MTATGPDLNQATAHGRLLASVQVSATGDTTVYTAPAGKSVEVRHGTLCNVSGSAVTISLALIPFAGAADGTHRVVSNYPLAAGDTLPLRDYLNGAQLGPGDYVSINCATGAAVDVVLSGVEYA